MLSRKLISVLAILFLLSPFACPLMAASKTENSSHDCAGEQQKQEDQGMDSCCDQQAIQAKAVELKYWDSAEMFALVESISPSRISIAVQGVQDSAHLRLKTGDRLAKLSVLRI